jgi:small nuclear ribonucleoprotein (snRNP)-like protein
MEENEFIEELVGKAVLIKTRGGTGTQENVLTGEYKGTLIGFDGKFIKVEYEIKRFVEGASKTFKKTVVINIEYVITVAEYTPDTD